MDKLFSDEDILIFDLDGTLANTEKYHWQAHDMVTKKYGICLTNEDVLTLIGHTDTEIYTMINKKFGKNLDLNTAITDKVNSFLYLAEKNDIKPFKVMDDIVKGSKNKTKILLTSQCPEIIGYLFKKWNYDTIFTKIISLSGQKSTKLDEVKRLGIDFNRIVVFEDTPRVIEAFRENKIRCIAVINDFNKEKYLNDSYSINALDEEQNL